SFFRSYLPLIPSFLVTLSRDHSSHYSHHKSYQSIIREMASRSVSLNHSHDEKILLKESSVQLTSLTDLISTRRILSLYPSTLVISKQKGGTFKTKEKVKIDKVWISNGSSPEFSFIIGWPLTNYLVQF
ncbi:hypothetical protein PMAYCL1PPCAC_23554, partial [Pristionchus mayeri]